jgi:hypothetical protein
VHKTPAMLAVDNSAVGTPVLDPGSRFRLAETPKVPRHADKTAEKLASRRGRTSGGKVTALGGGVPRAVRIGTWLGGRARTASGGGMPLESKM